jgi:hypothetical protein
MSPLDQFRGAAARDQGETLLASLPWAEQQPRIRGPHLMMLSFAFTLIAFGAFV